MHREDGCKKTALPERFAVVAGAPRCGTTSLSHFLAGHPEVCFSAVKEPHFFVLNDLSGNDPATLRRRVLADYVPRFFAGCRQDAPVWAEGSVSFLYAPEAAKQLLQVWPAARFVIALRDPMEMLPSLHERNLYQGDETIEDFAEAWRLIPARARGEAVPRSCIDPRILRYDIAGRLGFHLGTFFEAVGRQRCLVLLHEDLLDRPGHVIRALYGFLGLSDDGRRTLPRVRSGRRYRSGTLQRLLKRPPLPLQGLLAGHNHRQRTKRLDAAPAVAERAISTVFRLRKLLLEMNTAPSARRPIPPPLEREIRDCFEDDVDRLGRLIGRDLSHWLATGRTAAGVAEPKLRHAAGA